MFGHNGAGRDQVLAVVEDQQPARLAELGAEAFKGRALRGKRQTERGGGRRRHQRGIAQARQLHQPDAIVARAQPRRRSLDSEAGLARPAGAGQREQAIAVKQTGDLPQLPVAPDEARQRDRQVMASRLSQLARRVARALASAASAPAGRGRPHRAAAPDTDARSEGQARPPGRAEAPGAAGDTAPTPAGADRAAANNRISAR